MAPSASLGMMRASLASVTLEQREHSTYLEPVIVRIVPNTSSSINGTSCRHAPEGRTPRALGTAVLKSVALEHAARFGTANYGTHRLRSQGFGETDGQSDALSSAWARTTHARTFDTPPGLKPHGFSGCARRIRPRERLSGLPDRTFLT